MHIGQVTLDFLLCWVAAIAITISDFYCCLLYYCVAGVNISLALWQNFSSVSNVAHTPCHVSMPNEAVRKLKKALTSQRHKVISRNCGL